MNIGTAGAPVFAKRSERTGKKHSVIAWQAGISPETLSRILSGRNTRPGFDIVVRVIHATGETVGWVLGERGFRLTSDERSKLLEAAEIIVQTEGWRIVYRDEIALLRLISRLPE